MGGGYRQGQNWREEGEPGIGTGAGFEDLIPLPSGVRGAESVGRVGPELPALVTAVKVAGWVPVAVYSHRQGAGGLAVVSGTFHLLPRQV